MIKIKAGVAEPVDAPDSKSGSGNGVGVRVSPPAPIKIEINVRFTRKNSKVSEK